jgi:hypothetical protein
MAVTLNSHPSILSSPTKQSTIITSQECSTTDIKEEENFLVVSPYHEKAHLLDLSRYGLQDQTLAKALTGLQCLREDYATAPYVEIFNWSEVVGKVRQLAVSSNFSWKEQDFYIVVFRSQIPPTTVYNELGALDKIAHAEATKSGGFLKYTSSTALSIRNTDSFADIGLDHLTQ